jgi:hypothetical protein
MLNSFLNRGVLFGLTLLGSLMPTVQASELRFRPELEIPSKYSLSSREKRVTERDYGPVLDQISSLFPTFYKELEQGTFKTSELVLPIQKLVYPNLLECGSSESPEDLKSCVIDVVSPLLFGLRNRNLIDDVVVTDLLDADLYLNQPNKSSFIQQYWNTLKVIQKNIHVMGDSKMNPYQKRSRFRKDFAGYEDLTPREYLYRKYNYFQIIKMSQIITMALNIQSSRSGEVSIDYDGDGKQDFSRELSFEERFRFGEQELARMMHTENLSGEFLKHSGFGYTDLMMAGLETGVLDMNVVNQISSVVEMNDPRSNLGKSLLTILKNVGVSVLTMNPVTAPYAITGMLLVNTYQEVQNAKKRRSNDLVF